MGMVLCRCAVCVLQDHQNAIELKTTQSVNTYRRRQQRPCVTVRWAVSIWRASHACMVQLVLRLSLVWSVQRTAKRRHPGERQSVQQMQIPNSTAYPIRESPTHQNASPTFRMGFVWSHNRRKMMIRCSPVWPTTIWIRRSILYAGNIGLKGQNETQTFSMIQRSWNQAQKFIISKSMRTGSQFGMMLLLVIASVHVHFKK